MSEADFDKLVASPYPPPIPSPPAEDCSLDELRSQANSQFLEYMYARQILSTLSKSTIRRHSRGLPKQPRMTQEEKDLSHGLVAAIYTYGQDAVACSQSGADFASGLMASAACEALAILRLLQCKKEVKKTKRFQKLWRRRVRMNTMKPSPIMTFSKFLVELRVDDLYSLARDVGLYDERDIPQEVSKALASRGYKGRLTEFVKQARNCIHPKRTLDANDKYAKILDVFYSPNDMKRFHIDFALCAWELHGRLSLARKNDALDQ
jgi:hypothetical protein